MIKKNTLILLIIMLAMVGGYVLLQQTGKVGFLTKPEPATATPLPAFLSLNTTQVESIRLVRPNQPDVTVSKSGDAWQIDAPGGAVTAEDVLGILTDFNTTRTSAALSVDLGGQATGLDAPQYTFIIGLSGGAQRTIKVGKLNPTGTGYYAQVDANPVVVITASGINNIVTTFQRLMTPPATATPTPGS